MKTMKNFKTDGEIIQYESTVETFTSGGAYIPSSKKFKGRNVKVVVLPNA